MVSTRSGTGEPEGLDVATPTPAAVVEAPVDLLTQLSQQLSAMQEQLRLQAVELAAQSAEIAALRSAPPASPARSASLDPVAPSRSAVATAGPAEKAGTVDASSDGTQRPTRTILRQPNKPETFGGFTKTGLTADAWLFALETYFVAAQLEEHEKVPHAVTSLKSQAAVWWRSRVKRLGAQCTFEQFSKELLEAFQPDDPERIARAKLANIRQTGTIAEYVAAFNSCLFYVNDFSDKQQTFTFVEGLKSDVHREVDAHDPETLQDAIRWAYAAERHLRHVKQRAQRAVSAASVSTSRANAVQAVEEVNVVAKRSKPKTQSKCWNCEQVGHTYYFCKEPRDEAKIALERQRKLKSGNA